MKLKLKYNVVLTFFAPSHIIKFIKYYCAVYNFAYDAEEDALIREGIFYIKTDSKIHNLK